MRSNPFETPEASAGPPQPDEGGFSVVVVLAGFGVYPFLVLVFGVIAVFAASDEMSIFVGFLIAIVPLFFSGFVFGRWLPTGASRVCTLIMSLVSALGLIMLANAGSDEPVHDDAFESTFVAIFFLMLTYVLTALGSWIGRRAKPGD